LLTDSQTKFNHQQANADKDSDHWPLHMQHMQLRLPLPSSPPSACHIIGSLRVLQFLIHGAFVLLFHILECSFLFGIFYFIIFAMRYFICYFQNTLTKYFAHHCTTRGLVVVPFAASIDTAWHC